MKSSFNYNIRQVKGQPFIMIQDLNEGGMSVTNDIENIIGWICRKEIINPVEYHIIYQDSELVWDGFNYATKQFISLNCKHWLEASNKMITL